MPRKAGQSSQLKKAKASSPLRIGGRLKHARIANGLRLVDLAERVGCSESLLSKIENNKVTPSLSILHRLSEVIGTSIDWFIASNRGDPQIVVRREDRLVVEFNVHKTEGSVVERLNPYSTGQLLQALLFEVEPGGHSLSDIEHDGEEFGYILHGEFELTVDGTAYHLKEGDTFQFRSDLPHGFRNLGEEVVRILWVNTQPNY